MWSKRLLPLNTPVWRVRTLSTRVNEISSDVFASLVITSALRRRFQLFSHTEEIEQSSWTRGRIRLTASEYVMKSNGMRALTRHFVWVVPVYRLSAPPQPNILICQTDCRKLKLTPPWRDSYLFSMRRTKQFAYMLKPSYFAGKWSSSIVRRCPL